MEEKEEIIRHPDALRYPDAEWSLPFLFVYEPIYGVVHEIYKKLGCKNPPKANLFGTPACMWSGGRVPSTYERFTPKNMEKIFKYCNDLNATPTLTFTSVGLTNEDIKNPYANSILDAALEANGRFIVYDDRLKDHIKNKNPNAPVIASVLKPIFRFQEGGAKVEDPTVENETNYYNKLLKEYDIIVVRPEYSKGPLYDNPELLDDISRIEILINQPCVLRCTNAFDHYSGMEIFKDERIKGDGFKCALHGQLLTKRLEDNFASLHKRHIVKKLMDAGVKHLKLQGRGAKQPYQKEMYCFVSQIFDLDGYYYPLLESLEGFLNTEINHFENMFKLSNRAY